MSGNPPNWIFTVCSFIGLLMCLIPLPWHLEAWNIGTCMYMIWTALGCFVTFVNSVVWNSDVINRAPVWCDISSQIIIAVAIGVPTSSLCINRRLYQIASVQSVTRTRAEKRRDIMIDLAIGVGIPILQLALHPIVQSHRFLIFEQIGCYPFTLSTPASYPLFLVWPIVIGLVSASYSVRSIRELVIRRAQFKEFLATNKSLSSGRYFRLMALASLEVLLTVPLGCISVYLDLAQGNSVPYVNWATAHAGFSTIIQLPVAVWQADPFSAGIFQMARYSIVFCAFVFFAFFGFADEAMRNYRLAYASVAKRVGLSTGTVSTTGTWTANGTNSDSAATMPVYVTRETEKKRDSFASYSSRLTLPDVGGALADVKESHSPTTTLSTSISRESFPRSPMDMNMMPLPVPPEATFDINAPPRYMPDVPHAV